VPAEDLALIAGTDDTFPDDQQEPDPTQQEARA
jgi:hypothetical protein